ncbi:zinc-binding dehydrogenase [Paraburkholderia fungorum]
MRSIIAQDGVLRLSLENVTIGDPGEDEIIVRVEAAPINPSDLGLMLGSADISSLAGGGTQNNPVATLKVPENRLAAARPRIGLSLSVGNEGAGTVIAAGAKVKALEGKRVGMVGGAMYADYRRIRADDVIVLPDDVTAAQGASLFINPLTALGFVETMRIERHSAIVHTAAASNLGQMLQKICLADDIPLVNIVRSEEQATILRNIGATHIVNSNAKDFSSQLSSVIEQTGATIAFDAIGGGELGSEILYAMEQAAVRKMTEYSRYGSDIFKQLYLYGALDSAPTILNRVTFGFQWGVGGWLLFPFLRKAGPEVEQRMRKRVLEELTTTFASHFTQTISLAEALQTNSLRAYERKATGEKYLIDPTLG